MLATEMTTSDAALVVTAVSDGLAGDFAKLCRAAQVGASIEAARVPLSEAARAVIAAEPAMLEVALTGGDDYEIVCTVPAARADSFRAAAFGREGGPCSSTR